MNRRKFLTTTAAGAALFACSNESKQGSSQARSQKKHKWRLQLIVNKTLPIWADHVINFAEKVKVISDGRLDIRVYGAGELTSALETFNKVSDGTIEMGHSASYFWGGKIPGAEFFTSIPFGMNSDGMNAWIYSGGGLALWEELYRPYQVVPIPCGNTGVQMAGWFKKEINSLNDLKGLRMRIPGLGGKVMAKAGVAVEIIPQADLQTAFATGRIDATEWVGPYHDYSMNFHEYAKFYYTGGWHEPGSMLELIINQKAWDSLSDDLKLIVKVCAAEANKLMFTEWLTKDAEYLEILKNEKQVQLREYPVEVVKQMKIYAQEVIQEVANTNDLTKKIYDSFSKYQRLYNLHQDASERAYVKALKA